MQSTDLHVPNHLSKKAYTESEGKVPYILDPSVKTNHEVHIPATLPPGKLFLMPRDKEVISSKSRTSAKKSPWTSTCDQTDNLAYSLSFQLGIMAQAPFITSF